MDPHNRPPPFEESDDHTFNDHDDPAPSIDDPHFYSHNPHEQFQHDEPQETDEDVARRAQEDADQEHAQNLHMLEHHAAGHAHEGDDMEDDFELHDGDFDVDEGEEEYEPPHARFQNDPFENEDYDAAYA
jgi:hypothetical protein